MVWAGLVRTRTSRCLYLWPSVMRADIMSTTSSERGPSLETSAPPTRALGKKSGTKSCSLSTRLVMGDRLVGRLRVASPTVLWDLLVGVRALMPAHNLHCV